MTRAFSSNVSPSSLVEMSDIAFLIIGATKSATTWLQRSLQMDAVVQMPDPELHYFSREYHRGAAWYLSQFPIRVRGALVGEKSNSYLECDQAAQRIRAALPHAKLIVQLRSPVERAYSDYCMLYRRGDVGRDIDRYLDPRFASDNRFLNGGLYAQQLKAYFDLFPAQQLLVVFYEDLRSTPASHIARVREFLGLAPDVPPLAPQQRIKDKRTPAVPPHVQRRLRALKGVVAPLRGTRWFQALRGLVAQELEYPPLSAELRVRLVEYYAEEVDALGKLLGRDLTSWLFDHGGGRQLVVHS